MVIHLQGPQEKDVNGEQKVQESSNRLICMEEPVSALWHITLRCDDEFKIWANILIEKTELPIKLSGGIFLWLGHRCVCVAVCGSVCVVVLCWMGVCWLCCTCVVRMVMLHQHYVNSKSPDHPPASWCLVSVQWHVVCVCVCVCVREREREREREKWL